jgi:hypothetical protein
MKIYVAPDGKNVWGARLGEIFCADAPNGVWEGGTSGDALSIFSLLDFHVTLTSCFFSLNIFYAKIILPKPYFVIAELPRWLYKAIHSLII